jgi:hypothetical protein
MVLSIFALVVIFVLATRLSVTMGAPPGSMRVVPC